MACVALMGWRVMMKWIMGLGLVVAPPVWAAPVDGARAEVLAGTSHAAIAVDFIVAQ